MGLEAEILTVIGHRKSGAKSRRVFGLNFRDLIHGSKSRATAQFSGEAAELVGGANRVDFYAAIGQVLGVSCNANCLRRIRGKITIADALYPARNKESLSLLFSLPLLSSRSGILPERAHGN
jgi:hypothetical protein